MPYIQFQFRRDTAPRWTIHNPTLASGEMGLEIDTDFLTEMSLSVIWHEFLLGFHIKVLWAQPILKITI